MISKHINELLETAENKLDFAERELSRPSEDSVTFSVCHSSNNAIRQYLASLIAFNYSLEYPEEDIVFDTLKQMENWDINFLIKYASGLDPRFAALDIEHLNCAGLEKIFASDVYCLAIDAVRKCSITAREIAEYVNEYINTVKEPRNIIELQRVMQSSHN